MLLSPEVPDNAVIESHCMILGYAFFLLLLSFYSFFLYQSMLKVLVEMERNGIIKEDDLTMLKSILKAFRADLKKKIDNYEEKTKGKSTTLFVLVFVCLFGVEICKL